METNYKKKPQIALLHLMLALLSCASLHDSPDNKSKEILTIKEYQEIWKNDSLGCSRLRTKEIAEILIDSLGLADKDSSSFIASMGPPNIKHIKEDATFLGYYFSSICISNRLVDSFDYCLAEYEFRNNKLISRIYICK